MDSISTPDAIVAQQSMADQRLATQLEAQLHLSFCRVAIRSSRMASIIRARVRILLLYSWRRSPRAVLADPSSAALLSSCSTLLRKHSATSAKGKRDLSLTVQAARKPCGCKTQCPATLKYASAVLLAKILAARLHYIVLAA